MKLNLHLRSLWPGDPGHVAGTIMMAGHTTTIRPWWADCGATGEDIICSCGFASHEASGHGCWQYGHNKEIVHSLDELHRAMWDVAHEWESQQDWLS